MQTRVTAPLGWTTSDAQVLAWGNAGAGRRAASPSPRRADRTAFAGTERAFVMDGLLEVTAGAYASRVGGVKEERPRKELRGSAGFPRGFPGTNAKEVNGGD